MRGLTNIAAALFLCASAARGLAQETGNAACAQCHDVAAKLEKSAHAKVGCASCHVKHEEFPHPEGIAKPLCASCHQRIAAEHSRSVHGDEIRKGNAVAPECATCHGAAHETKIARSAEFRAGVPDMCGMCHSDIETEYQTSVHGKAVARGEVEAPVCTDCHGEHAILPPRKPASSVNGLNIRETCGSCHGNVRLARQFGFPADRLVSFDASFHGLAAKAGSQTVANCASCHGIHNILPSSDPKSTINPSHLAATCGRCHPGAGSRFTIGSVHLIEARGEPVAVTWVRRLYLGLIPITIGLMLLHNAGDWARKLYRLRLSRASVAIASQPGVPEQAFRMFAFERVQHALLAISFVVLAWSGFALKYPGQWWSGPLLLWESAASLRSVTHRAAAVVFMAVAAMHVISLLASRTLREHWKSLAPARSDLGDAAGGFAYNLGLRKSSPALPEHSYIEKAEYWAMVWGALVMTLTGLGLWANNLILSWLPKSVLDVATSVHFYEAVLATLAIVVWHLYSVIFDPDVYPMDPSALTGFSPRPRRSEPKIATAVEEKSNRS